MTRYILGIYPERKIRKARARLCAKGPEREKEENERDAEWRDDPSFFLLLLPLSPVCIYIRVYVCASSSPSMASAVVAATLDIKNFNILAPRGGKHIMYSADVPAILSAGKTHSFSVESNPAHARARICIVYSLCRLSTDDDDTPSPLSHDAHTFRFATTTTTTPRSQRKFLCLACPASRSLAHPYARVFVVFLFLSVAPISRTADVFLLTRGLSPFFSFCASERARGYGFSRLSIPVRRRAIAEPIDFFLFSKKWSALIRRAGDG